MDETEQKKRTIFILDTLLFKYSKALEQKDFYAAAETNRLILDQLNFECHQSGLHLDCEVKLKEQWLEKYSQLVDNPDCINNYADAIQRLSVTENVDTTKWKSNFAGMNDEQLLNLVALKEKSKLTNNPLLEQYTLVDGEQSVSFNNDNFWKKITSVINNAKPYMQELVDDPELVKQTCYTPHCTQKGTELSKSTKLVQKGLDAYTYKDNNQTNCKRKATQIPQKDFLVREPTIYNEAAKKQKQTLGKNFNGVSNEQGEVSFKTAKDMILSSKSNKNCDQQANNSRKFLGTRRGISSKFVTPIMNSNDEEEKKNYNTDLPSENTDERLKNIDPKMIEIMMNEIKDDDSSVTWDDIAGLEFAKKTLKEIVVWPLLRPDIFTGLRGPPKGILLFGPPGTGKTLIGKCVASQSKSTFFSISASSLGSKWVGEGEKLVRALFAVARCYQPAVIFIDEIDSLLTQRSDSEHESSRRIKTEFLVQFDGVKTSSDERLLIIGATNRPQELDEAARRRLVKRLYIPLPEAEARIQIVKVLLNNQAHELTENDLCIIQDKTDGYSGADMANLCKEAALGPIRSINFDEIAHITKDDVRPIKLADFIEALQQVRASVGDSDLRIYEEWNKKYGSGVSH